MQKIKRNVIIIVLVVVILLPLTAAWYAFGYEPYNLKISEIELDRWDGPKIVHISDFHYEGDRFYASRVISAINEQQPEVVCFTGDFITRKQFLPEALEWLGKIHCPVIAVPGNHEFWQKVDLDMIGRELEKNGGKLLLNDTAVYNGVRFVGKVEPGDHVAVDDYPKQKVLLCHYPAAADNLPAGDKYDLILSGHTHGGQVRLPFYGPVLIPYNSGSYEYGFYETKAGPMYVTSGIGNIWGVRFFCRPEIAVISVNN